MRTIFFYITIIVSALHTQQAAAQLEVSLAFERFNFVSGEKMEATVAIRNTGGRDTVLGGPNGTAWANFLIRSEDGQLVTSINEPASKPIMCRTGERIERRFNLPQYFYLAKTGTYTVKALVYFPPLQRWIQSRPVRFTVQPPSQAKWAHSFSLPDGHRMAGTFRRYQLFHFHDTQKTYLFLGIKDESSGLSITTQALSTIILNRDMQPAVDSSQNLHVLYLGSPTVWVYQSIDPDGKILSQKFYQAGKATPQLLNMDNGDVMVSGGTIYDPTVKQPGPTFRRLSDRPAGIVIE